jgi:hypothetical protein
MIKVSEPEKRCNEIGDTIEDVYLYKEGFH